VVFGLVLIAGVTLDIVFGIRLKDRKNELATTQATYNQL
jgi:hypothetical protein